ncbi:MAG: SRPBCC family protein [Hyphomicrobiaceae bacterium]|nr:SRPBCC family protein [Hyphomicrobiaceae bacterium]
MARTTTGRTETVSTQPITISANVSAPVAKVWNAFTTPAGIKSWNFASDDWCCPSAEVDLRVGGKHKARMEAKDGSFGFDFEAEYSEVVPNKVIAFVMTDGRRARTTFEQQGSATVVTTVFDAESQNSIEMQRNGWQAILDNFKRYVERL